jgi:hypothetical protein
MDPNAAAVSKALRSTALSSLFMTWHLVPEREFCIVNHRKLRKCTRGGTLCSDKGYRVADSQLGASARRPASVIRSRAIATDRPPAAFRHSVKKSGKAPPLASWPAPGIGSAPLAVSPGPACRPAPAASSLAMAKDRCRRAYRMAREAGAPISALIDRSRSETLTQISGQSAAESAIMLTRIAILFEIGDGEAAKPGFTMDFYASRTVPSCRDGRPALHRFPRSCGIPTRPSAGTAFPSSSCVSAGRTAAAPRRSRPRAPPTTDA